MLVLVLSIAVLVIELVALPQHSRFDYENEHRFTEHEHVVVFSKLPTAHCPLPTAHCPLPTANCQLPTANCQLPPAFDIVFGAAIANTVAIGR